MPQAVPDVLHLYREMDPEGYQRYQEGVHTFEFIVGATRVALIAGIFASVIGIAAVATAAFFLETAIIPGCLMLGSGLGMSYLSWNVNALATNIVAILGRPLDYITGGRLDDDLMRNRLRRNTIGFDPFVDSLMDRLRMNHAVD